MAARRSKASAGCPVCGKTPPPKAAFVPFCSDRCKMVDLGRWFTGDYVIAGEDAIRLDPEELDEFLRRAQSDEASDGDDPDDHA